MGDSPDIDRRALLRGSWLKPKRRPPPRTVVRPPGALPEETFLKQCTGCDDCHTACPFGAIMLTGPRNESGAHTPELFLDVSPCRMCEDVPCAAACTTGALVPIEHVNIRMASMYAVDEHCWSKSGFKTGCNECYEACPLPGTAITHHAGDAPEFHEGCTGCGLCFSVCPAPAKAIRFDPL